MSKYYDKTVIGIDVASEFSKAAILSPRGDIYKNSFKIAHNLNGFNYFITQIKKAENEFSMKPIFFMESTGKYHLPLFYFLQKNNYEVFLINPLVTNSNKNKDIRKVKTDKRDAISIAKLAKYEDIKAYSYFDISIFTLKSLCRDYYKLVDSRTMYKHKLNSELNLIFPGFKKVFSNTTGNSSIAILKLYQTPTAILNANKEEVIETLKKASKKNIWCYEIYEKLIKVASEAKILAIPSTALSIKVLTNISIIESITEQINLLKKEICAFVKSNEVPESFRNNIKLIDSIGGIGELSAISLMAEIGEINNFKKPKQLLAYLGIDPSVNESGKFKGDRNKMSKRGSRIARRVLYSVSIAIIAKKVNGTLHNSSLYNYYQKLLLQSKKKKVAIGAVMHKLVNYIFAVLRDQKQYEERLPEIHCQMFLKNKKKFAA